MCGYICIGFIDFMLKSKSLEYTNLFSPSDYEKNDKMILKYFKYNLIKFKCIVMFCSKYRKFKKTKT